MLHNTNCIEGQVFAGVAVVVHVMLPLAVAQVSDKMLLNLAFLLQTVSPELCRCLSSMS